LVDELRRALGAIHVGTLARLLSPSGIALLVTDLATNQTYPFDALPADASRSPRAAIAARAAARPD
jgi:hypothetical protein